MNKINIIGGGLWGGLLAYRLQIMRSDIDFEIYEKESVFGGEHTWSFHETDLSSEQLKWLKPFVKKSWPGYEVRFPEYQRQINIPYYSIESGQFHKVLTQAIPPEKIHFNKTLSPESFRDIDARGIYQAPPCGYQKFYGLELLLDKPHSLSQPILMDATVMQKDGFRFMYVLPFDERTLLIEDTRYSETRELDIADCKSEILKYAEKNQWNPNKIIRREEGALPIPFFSIKQQDAPFINLSGNFHDVTGYSLPQAVKIIDNLVAAPLSDWQRITRAHNFTEKGNRQFYRLLNRLMFHAAPPEERYKVLEFFYRSSFSSISKFYSGDLSTWDKIKFFAGRPPVPVGKALEVLAQNKRETACFN